MPSLVGIGNSQVPTNAMLGGMAYQDTHNTSIVSADINDISAIKGSVRKTAVSVFVYNTADDSDGGAWRHRCTNTSWYNMELGTRDRGHRREFPSVAVIVMEAGGATPGTHVDFVIYDGDDPSFPMWMTSRFAISTSGNNWGSIVAKNGWIVHGRTNNGIGIYDFIHDTVTVHNHAHRHQYHKISKAITGNNGDGERAWISATGFAIQSEYILDLDIGVPAGSKIDPISKMPIPSIFIGNSGSSGGDDGWTLIRSDGSTATQGTGTGSNSNGRHGSNARFILNDSVIFAGKNTYGSSDRHSNAYEIITRHHGFPKTHQSAYIDFVDNGSDGNRANQINFFGNFNAGDISGGSCAIDENEFATTLSTNANSLVKYWIRKDKIRASMVSVTTDAYCTGWMPGEFRNAHCIDTTTGTISGSDGGLDRGQHAAHLDVTGTITKERVASGSDLVCFSGWASGNNLRGDVTGSPGTGDFCVQAWVRSPDSQPSGNYFHMWSQGTTGTGGQSSGTGFVLKCLASSNGLQWYPYSGDNDNQGIDHSKCIQRYGAWAHVAVGRDGGVWKLYINGLLRDTGDTDSDSKTDVYLTMGIGLSQTSEHLDPAPKIALVRYNTGFMPTPEMFEKIYRDELPLFEENAKCTLYGSSNLIKGMDYDKSTGLLHAGTSAGRSDFRGFNRINNTTTAVTHNISAAAGIIAEQ